MGASASGGATVLCRFRTRVPKAVGDCRIPERCRSVPGRPSSNWQRQIGNAAHLPAGRKPTGASADRFCFVFKSTRIRRVAGGRTWLRFFCQGFRGTRLGRQGHRGGSRSVGILPALAGRVQEWMSGRTGPFDSGIPPRCVPPPPPGPVVSLGPGGRSPVIARNGLPLQEPPAIRSTLPPRAADLTGFSRRPAREEGHRHKSSI